MLPSLEIKSQLSLNDQISSSKKSPNSKKITNKQTKRYILNDIANNSFIRNVKLQIGKDNSQQEFNLLNVTYYLLKQSRDLESSFENNSKIYLSLKKRETRRKIPTIQDTPGPSDYFPQQYRSFDNYLPQSQFLSGSPKFNVSTNENPDPCRYEYVSFIDEKIQRIQKKNQLKKKYQNEHNRTAIDDIVNQNINFHRQRISSNQFLKQMLEQRVFSQARNVGNFTISKKDPKSIQIDKDLNQSFKYDPIPGPGAYEIYKDPISQKNAVLNSVFKSKVQKVSFVDSQNKNQNLGPGRYSQNSNFIKKQYNINLDKKWN